MATKRPQYELELLHPMVANWLTENGFEWRYEVMVSELCQKRIDFIATRDNEVWLIECKVKPQPKNTVHQLNVYHTLYKVSTAYKVLAIPSNKQTKKLLELCDAASVKLLLFTGDFNEFANNAPHRVAPSSNTSISLEALTDAELLEKIHPDLRADFVRLPSNGKLTTAQLDAVFPPTPERDTALREILQMGMRRAREKSHT